MGCKRETLAEIGRLGQYAQSRRHDFLPDEPCQWAPQTIVCPETGMCFSDRSAWGLICELLLHHPEMFEEVILKIPPGQVAYQTVHTLSDGTRVYIKVQLSQGKARARSFHISEVE